MSWIRWLAGWLTVTLLLAGFRPPAPAIGQEAEVVGMITELKMGQGRVEVLPAGARRWRSAGPLLALRSGDTVRATEDASAVILLSGGRGSVTVKNASSPFVVPAPDFGESKAQKVLKLLEAAVGFLSTTAKEVALSPPLATRGGSGRLVIVSPRNGPVLPDSLTFEWVGSRFSRYTVRIVGPRGVVLEREVRGATFQYPPDAPPLAAGTRYTLEVASANRSAQQAWFELLDMTVAEAIRRDVMELEEAAGPTVSPSTLATLRAAFLARNGLLHDARLSVMAALAKDPDEPTLHLLLGRLYSQVGLPEQATESFNEVRFLLGIR